MLEEQEQKRMEDEGIDNQNEDLENKDDEENTTDTAHL